jgi:hypothetical protein
MKKAYNDARFKIQQQREAQRQQQLRRPYAFDPNVAAAAAPAAAPEMALVSGAVWYKQQGFRAYNQALGRCIRNQMDYGASQLDVRLAYRAFQNNSGLFHPSNNRSRGNTNSARQPNHKHAHHAHG